MSQPKKRSWLIFLLDILDPGRHTRGDVWFERPGCVCFNVDKALKNQRKAAQRLNK